MRRVHGMLTVGVLFAVSLGMLPKEEPTLQRLFKPHVLKLFLTLLSARRSYVTTAHLRKHGVIIGCAACSNIVVHGKTATPHTMIVGQGLENKWSVILRVTSVCKFTRAGEMRNLRLKRTGRQSREHIRVSRNSGRTGLCNAYGDV